MILKKHLLVLLGIFVLTGCSCGEKRVGKSGNPEFKMILRLWPDHHKNIGLRNDLSEALKTYTDLFDEAWFCMEIETLSMDEHKKSAIAMDAACRQLRDIGVEASIQGISVGHGDSFESGSDALIPQKWGTITDVYGNVTRMSNCPRQQAFLDYMAETYALYAEICKPKVVWLDDDLRITNHAPARQLCFCDTCIAEFNRLHHTNWTRTALADALDRNEDNGLTRKQWIEFSQKSLAQVTAVVARSVHRVSPSTQMGLQHANFHRELMEGRDWNLIFDAMKQETGFVPASRPGNGFYEDHAPRGMIQKAYDMARQIRRLNPDITEITAEVEGYRHCATGKSPHGLCIESLLYLAMGATQLSYAIICAASEPMEWYAGNYFKALSGWRSLYEEYVGFNRGTEPGGINPYISPEHVLRKRNPAEAPFGWTTTGSGDVASEMAPLGIPFCPDGNNATALLLDAAAVTGLTEKEAADIFQNQNVLLDGSAWNIVRERKFDAFLTETGVPAGLTGVTCFTSGNGGRTAVVPSFGASINNAQRLNLLYIIDWLSGHRLPVIMETMAQAVVVPRVDAENRLRSVTLLNCSISEQSETQLRLRGCGADKKKSYVWKKAGQPDTILRPQYDGTDVLVRIPALEGWNIGWLAVE